MAKAFLSIIGVIAIGGLVAGRALAGHGEPLKAKKLQFDLVNSFFRCDVPNTSMQSFGRPSACTPAVPEAGGGCAAITQSGSGKLTLAVAGSAAKGTQDLKIAAAVAGLDKACVGLQLCVTLSYRLSADDCPEGSCSSFDIENYELPVRCAVGDVGTCKIKARLSDAFPGFLASGKNTGFEFHGCGLKGSFPALGPPEITCGMLFK